MRRLLLLLAGLGIARLLFWRRAAHTLPPAPRAAPEVDPRAEALRAKLEEGSEAVAEEADPDARRRRVHEAGRAAVEEMRASGGERVDDESA